VREYVLASYTKNSQQIEARGEEHGEEEIKWMRSDREVE
jgi:hypothetical protein